VDITSRITLLPGANRIKVEQDFQQFVVDFFDTRNLSIGDLVTRRGDVHVSDWDAGIAPGFDGEGGIEGVDFIETSTFQLRPQVETIQAIGEPTFSTISYTVFTTDAFWEVLFLDPLNYRVFKQELTGGPKIPQAQIGALDAAFTDDNNEIQLVISVPSGATAPVSGDRFRIRSSPQRSSVRILNGEVAAQGVVNFEIVGGS
jgi:hypothetical protein